MKCGGCGSECNAETGALVKASPDLQELLDLFDVDSLHAVVPEVAKLQKSLETALGKNESLALDLAEARKKAKLAAAAAAEPEPASAPAPARPGKKRLGLRLR